MKRLALTFILLLTVGTLFTSCREKTTGEKIEDGIEEVGDGIEDAADDAGDAVEDVADDVEDELD